MSVIMPLPCLKYSPRNDRAALTPRPHRAGHGVTGVGTVGDEGMVPQGPELPVVTLVLGYSDRYLAPIRWATVT